MHESCKMNGKTCNWVKIIIQEQNQTIESTQLEPMGNRMKT